MHLSSITNPPVRIRLPARPPPLSSLYTEPAGRRGRVKTKRYRDWQRICAPSLRAVGREIKGFVRVEYKFLRPDKRKRDLGNLEKAMSDILVYHNIIEDDSLIVDLRLLWAGEQPAEVWVWPYNEEDGSSIWR